MQKALTLVLLIAAFALGYFGIKNLDEKTADIKIGEVELTAKSSETKNKGYALLGAGALCLIAGVVLLTKTKGKQA